MSLRVRLTATMVCMVVLAMLALSALHIHSQVSRSLTNVQERSSSTAQFVKSWILHRAGETGAGPPGESRMEIRNRWWTAIANDAELSKVLFGVLAQTKSIAEISIAGEKGRIIASSNTFRVGALMPERLTLASIMDLGPVDRLLAILGGRLDYESRVVLTQEGQAGDDPVFTIQVLVDSALLREEILPEINSMALVSILALLCAVFLAYVAAKVATRPLAHISETIDRIAAGEIELPMGDRRAAREFQAVEQKLRLLGAQFRGAKEGAYQLRSSMERQLAAINKLTGGVAHEIKNPLNSIAIRLELLRGHVRDMPEAEDELAIISQEITRLDRVVRTFLDFTRPVELATVRIDLTSMTRDILTLIDPEAGAAGVTIKLTSPAAPPFVRGDSDLLRQAIMNICRNSLDAMPAGGKLDVDIRQESTDAVLSIADSGPGIPAAERERIFQLYYSTKKKGTGIGLAMTFRAVQLHGGTIEVDGQPGEGAVFNVRLPLAT